MAPAPPHADCNGNTGNIAHTYGAGQGRCQCLKMRDLAGIIQFIELAGQDIAGMPETLEGD